MLPLEDYIYLKSLSEKERKKVIEKDKYYYIWLNKASEYERKIIPFILSSGIDKQTYV